MTRKKNKHHPNSPTQQQKNGQDHNQNSGPNQTPAQSFQNITGTAEMIGQSREVLYGQENSFPIANARIPNEGPYLQNAQSNIYTMNDFTQGQGQVFTNNGYGLLNTDFGRTMHRQDLPVHGGMQASADSRDNGIPNWASQLCNQVMCMQKALDSHLKSWQTVENHLATHSQKMAELEAKIADISKIKENYEETGRSLSQCKKEVKTLNQKVPDYDNTIQHYSDLCDDMTSNNSDFDKRIFKLEKRIESLEKSQTDTQERIDSTEEKIVELQWRSMRENLLFCGIPEASNFREVGENCETLIESFMQNELGIERSIPMDRAHRLGRYRRDHVRPRPVVVKFTSYKDKEQVKRIAHEKLPDTNYWVKDHFPREIENKRKLLYEVADEFRKNPDNKVKFVRDKLFINGAQYVPENQTTATVEPERRQKNFREGSKGQNARGRNIVPQTGRTFYRRQATQEKENQTSRSMFSNRFVALGERENEKDTTPRSYRTAGKKKATSPLENDASTKKQHVESGDESSDTDSETFEKQVLKEVPVLMEDVIVTEENALPEKSA